MKLSLVHKPNLVLKQNLKKEKKEGRRWHFGRACKYVSTIILVVDCLQNRRGNSRWHHCVIDYSSILQYQRTAVTFCIGIGTM